MHHDSPAISWSFVVITSLLLTKNPQGQASQGVTVAARQTIRSILMRSEVTSWTVKNRVGRVKTLARIQKNQNAPVPGAIFTFSPVQKSCVGLCGGQRWARRWFKSSALPEHSWHRWKPWNIGKAEIKRWSLSMCMSTRVGTRRRPSRCLTLLNNYVMLRC